MEKKKRKREKFGSFFESREMTSRRVLLTDDRDPDRVPQADLADLWVPFTLFPPISPHQLP